MLLAGSLVAAEVSCENCPLSGLTDRTGCELPAKVRVRAYVATPDGAGRELAFGQEKRLRLKGGGARLDLKLVPDLEAIGKLGSELVVIAEEHGAGEELLKRIGEAANGIDELGYASIRGVAVGADGSKEEFRIGNAANLKRKELDQMVAREGAAIELGIKPVPELMKTLDEWMALGPTPEVLADLAAAEARELLQEDAAERPAKPMNDPDLLKMAQRVATDPTVMKAVEEGLKDPDLLQFAQRAMEDGTAQQLLGQFLGTPTPPAKPEATNGGADHSEPDGSLEAEIGQLKKELAEQRALLNKILKRLEE